MLENNNVLITGANGGLGSAVTRAFLDAGARVVGVSRRITDAEFAHASFSAISASVDSASGASELVRQAIERVGRIDALVHLVGGFAGGQDVHEAGETTLDQMFQINFRALYYLLGAVLPHMRERRSGSIVAIGSRTTLEPVAGLGLYSASKAALVSLVRTVALENRDLGISANVVLPGTMDTSANRAAMPAADPARWVQPSQIAALLVHLASPQARQITGAVIPVYGQEL